MSRPGDEFVNTYFGLKMYLGWMTVRFHTVMKGSSVSG